jgi:adenine deaminase
VMATLHPARYHGLADHGAIAPGYRADIALLGDLTRFAPSKVFKDGRLVVDGGKVLPFERRQVPLWVRRSVRSDPVTASDFAIPSSGRRVRVIEVIPGQLLTNERA